MGELGMLVYQYKMDADLNSMRHLDFHELSSVELNSKEFAELCTQTAFTEILTELDVDEENQQDLFDNLDVDRGGTLDIGELLNGIGKMRGAARKADTIGVMLEARHISKLIKSLTEETSRMLAENTNALDMLKQGLSSHFGTVSKRHSRGDG